jgi:hypothetical protein
MRILGAGLGAVVLVLTPVWVLAQPPSQAPTESSEAAHRAELNAAWQSGQAAASKGPTQISLIDQGGLSLPDRRWLRTIRPGIPHSECVVANARRQTLPEFLMATAESDPLTKFIAERQDTENMRTFRLAL